MTLTPAQLVCKAIIEGNYTDAELSGIVDTVNRKLKLQRAQQKAVAAATLAVGMIVRIKGIRPAYLNGVTGKIVRFDGRGKTRATIEITVLPLFNDPRTRVGKEVTGIPLSCFEVVDSKPLFGASNFPPAPAPDITMENPNALVSFMAGEQS